MMTMIYLIRHALPDWSRKDIPYHLPPGPPLTQQGLAEAAQLGAYLKGADVRRLYASPLERAMHTAQIAAQAAGVSYEIHESLIEWQPEDTEYSVRRRMGFVFELARLFSLESGPVGLVTHGGPIAMLLLALGMSEETLEMQRIFDHGNPVPTAGVWRVAQDGEAGWELRLDFTPSTSPVPAARNPAGSYTPA